MPEFTPEQRKEFSIRGVATRKANRLAAEAAAAKHDAERAKYAGALGAQIKEMEDRIKYLSGFEHFNTVSVKLTNKTLLPSEEIIKHSMPWEGSTGVYFLIHNGEIVYVGQSVRLRGRIEQHTDKVFDSFSFVLCTQKHLDFLESLYIHQLRPKYNYTQSNGVKSAPLSFEDILKLVDARAEATT
jgi:hypothetical protein